MKNKITINGWGIIDKKSKKFKYGGIGEEQRPKWFKQKKNEIEIPIKITYET